jgi:membrane dipeptidase
MMPIIDGHLDIAMNALLHERDQTLPLGRIHQREAGGVAADRGEAMVTLPQLRQTGVALAVGSVIARCKPWVDPSRTIQRDDLDYPEPAMAYAAAQGQLAYYQQLQRQGELELVTEPAQLDRLIEAAIARSLDQPATGPLGLILMMEGADAIVEPEQVRDWHSQGLRCLSLAHFGHSRYAAGTPSKDPTSHEKDGPLSDRGRALLDAMNELTIALDLTHLGDTSFAQAIDRFEGPVCATHANCRTLANAPRQLSDRQLKAIIARDGVIGVALAVNMIRCDQSGELADRSRVQLRHLANHIDHICQLAGSAKHVALGTDLDGGFGREGTPADFEQYGDLHSLGPLLEKRGFSEADRRAFFFENWWQFYRRVLSGEDQQQRSENV